MLLPRLSQKEFTRIYKSSDILNDASLSMLPAKEFIKAVEMFDVENGKYVQHWLIKMFVSEFFVKGLRYNFFPQEFLAGSFESPERLVKVFGSNSTSEFLEKYQTPIDFIDRIKEDILTDTHHGEDEPKYESIFKSRNPKFNYSSEDYSKMLKFLALCLSGQVPEADWDRYWEVGERYVKRLEVNYNTLPNRSKSYLCKVIAKVFRSITGSDILSEYE